ncbi:MAG TPA: hypothetical protein VHI98_16720 [Vicinamibacterales bacterium]|nr:hypothetical protein [Vicinamibacterales bacterium]
MLRFATRAAEDPELIKHLAARRIPLEFCPLSNVRTGVIKSVEAHPLRQYLDAGIPISLNGSERWIQGDGNAAREQDAEVRLEERLLGPQEQRHTLARRDSTIAQACSNTFRVAPQLAVGNRALASRVFAQEQVDARRGTVGLPAERLGQRARGDRGGASRARRSGLVLPYSFVSRAAARTERP